MSFSAKRWAYSDMPSFSSKSAIPCTAAYPLRTSDAAERRYPINQLGTNWWSGTGRNAVWRVTRAFSGHGAPRHHRQVENALLKAARRENPGQVPGRWSKLLDAVWSLKT